MSLPRRCCLPLLIASAVAACNTAAPATDYRAADVQPVEVMPQPDGDVLIRYRVPAESVFHSPGANVRTASDGSLEVSLQRCGIQQQCPVTHPATATTGEPLQVEFLLHPRGRIFMVYRDLREQVFPAPPAAAPPPP
ncbi:MAG: hypothetical protein RR698_12955 [Stenotrophomonas sp.]